MLFKLLEKYSFPDYFDSTFHNKKKKKEQKGSLNYSLFNMQYN